MSSRQIRIWPYAVASAVLGLAGLYMLLSAITTASLRYWHCGPSDLVATEQYCRIGIQLAYSSYAVLFCALVFAVIAAWRWSQRRARL